MRATLLLSALLLIPSLAGAPLPAAEEAGMREYAVGLLVRGAGWTPGRTPATDSLQAGHLANMGAMHQAGLLVGAGPMLDGGALRGVWFFRADSIERVRVHVARDPAIGALQLRCDLRPWWGPSGIGEDYERRAAAGAPDSMVRYVFGLLVPGPAFTRADSPERREIQQAHLANIDRMAKAGQLILAGPFGDDGDLRGIFVFSTSDTALARRWADTDPAVRAGRLRVELHPWMVGYGVIPGH